jgi:hypothetical protein
MIDAPTSTSFVSKGLDDVRCGTTDHTSLHTCNCPFSTTLADASCSLQPATSVRVRRSDSSGGRCQQNCVRRESLSNQYRLCRLFSSYRGSSNSSGHRWLTLAGRLDGGTARGFSQFSTYMGATNGCEMWSAYAVGKLHAALGYSVAFSVLATASVLSLWILKGLRLQSKQAQILQG